MREKDSCPACGALPCDWTNDPHAQNTKLMRRLGQATQIIAALKDFALTKPPHTVFGKDAHEWAHLGTLWLDEACPCSPSSKPECASPRLS